MQESFVYGLRFAKRTLDANLRNITEEESMQQIPDINCINWLMGHLVSMRQVWIQKERPGYIFYEKLSSQYRTGNFFNADSANSLSQLIAWCNEQQQVLLGIAEENEIGKTDVFISYMLHELYHSGQIGMVRKLLGKGSGVGI